jgi:chemotaxis protein MotB
MRSIDRLAAVLASRGENMRIEGHTDNVAIHNAHFRSNWELSTSRATELVKLFIYRYHVAPSRLSAAGYAEFHPVAENTSADGRARNRRVDIVILNPTNSEQIAAPLSSPQATSSSPVSAPKMASSPKQPSDPKSVNCAL